MPSDAQASITEVEGVFAKGGIGNLGIILKKSNGIWVVIWDGQDGPFEDTAERFELPNGWYQQR